MRTIAFIVIAAITMAFTSPPKGGGLTNKQVFEIGNAILAVESSGNLYPKDGDGGKAVGPFQIWPIMVKDVNDISARRKLGRHYTLEDRRDLQRSWEIFCIYTMHYSRYDNYETIARRWNGGPDGDTDPRTDPYWVKVQVELRKQGWKP